MSLNGIRARLKRLEAQQAPAPRVSVWDVIAGAAHPHELSPADRAWLDTNFPAAGTREPVTDVAAEPVARLGATGCSPQEPPRAPAHGE